METKKIMISVLIYFILLLFLLFIGSGNFISPFYGDLNMIDEGLNGAWINHMFSGEHLYKDTYSAYGPFYIYPNYILSLIFGPSVFLTRILYLVIGVFFTIFIIVKILNKLEVPKVFQVLTIFLLAFVSIGVRQGIGFLSIFLFYLAFDKDKYIFSFLAGISIATSFLIGIDSGIFITLSCLPFLAFEFITNKDLKRVIKKTLTICAGSLLVFFFFIAWSYSEGWLFSYINSAMDDMKTYSGIDLPIGKSFPNPLHLFPIDNSIYSLIKFIFSKGMLLYWLFFFYMLTYIYLFVKFILKKSTRSDLLILLIVNYGFLLSTVLIGRNGHFTSALAPAFILFAYFFSEISNKFNKLNNKLDKITLLTLTLIMLVFSMRIVLVYRPNFPKLKNVHNLILSEKSNPEFIGNIYISGEQRESILEIQNFVKKNTMPEDTIFFFSNVPMLYFLVNRDSPNRFDLPEVASIKEKRLEILDSLKKDKTKYIIEDTKSYDLDEISNRRRLPEVFEYIRNNYEATRLGQYIVYKIKEN